MKSLLKVIAAIILAVTPCLAVMYADYDEPAYERMNDIAARTVTQNPETLISIGQFTTDELNFTLALDLTDGADSIIRPRMTGIRTEVYMLMADRDLTSTEGMLQFAEDIKNDLNSILPDVKGEAPIVNVLYEDINLQ